MGEFVLLLFLRNLQQGCYIKVKRNPVIALEAPQKIKLLIVCLGCPQPQATWKLGVWYILCSKFYILLRVPGSITIIPLLWYTRIGNLTFFLTSFLVPRSIQTVKDSTSCMRVAEERMVAMPIRDRQVGDFFCCDPPSWSGVDFVMKWLDQAVFLKRKRKYPYEISENCWP